MSERDLTTAEGAKAWFKVCMEMAAEEFLASPGSGDLTPLAMFVITRDDRTGLALPKPAVMYTQVDGRVVNDNSDRGAKDKLSIWLRRVAVRTDAIGFAFLSETWIIEESERKKIPKGTSFEHVPGRLEALSFFGQHKALGESNWISRAMITRPKKGHATLGPWEEPAYAKASGRFMNVLRPAEDKAAEEDAWRGMLEFGEGLDPEQRRHHIENVRAQMHKLGAVPRAEVDKNIFQLIAMLRARGQEVASRPGDPGPPRPRPSDTVVDVVNLSEEVPMHEITIEEARANLGRKVLCWKDAATPELLKKARDEGRPALPVAGVIAAVLDDKVFVLYEGDSKPTPEDPRLLSWPVEESEPGDLRVDP